MPKSLRKAKHRSLENPLRRSKRKGVERGCMNLDTRKSLWYDHLKLTVITVYVGTNTKLKGPIPTT